MTDHEGTGIRISNNIIDKQCFQLHVQVSRYYASSTDHEFRVSECSIKQQSKRNDKGDHFGQKKLLQLQFYHSKETSEAENEQLVRRSSSTSNAMHSSMGDGQTKDERSQLSSVQSQLILHAGKARIILHKVASKNDNLQIEDGGENEGISYKNDLKDQMNESLLIVLVPPTISQLAIKMIEQGSAIQQQDDRRYNCRKKKIGEPSYSCSSKGDKVFSSATVGRLIHPCLSDLPVHQVIVLDDQQQPRLCEEEEEKKQTFDPASVNERRPTNCPSDFIIFKLDKTMDAKEIIGKIHGEAMSCASFAVIKPFSVSDITYHCTQQQQHHTSLTHSDYYGNNDRRNLAASRNSSTANPSNIVTNRVNMEIPTCSVCLHRIDPVRLGFPSPKKHQLCSHHGASSNNDNLEPSSSNICKNRTFLTMWPSPSNCIACSVIQNNATVTFGYRSLEGLSSYSSEVFWQQRPRLLSGSSPHAAGGSANDRNNASPTPSNARLDFTAVAAASCNHQQIQSSKSSDITTKYCLDCGMKETLWLCLTCGFIGCGRYSHGHAINHFLINDHPFSLELVTGRIWAYNEAEYIQRNDFLKCPFIPQHIHESSFESPFPAETAALATTITTASSNPAAPAGLTSIKKSSDNGVRGETLVCESTSFLGDKTCQNQSYVHKEKDGRSPNKNECGNSSMPSSSCITTLHGSQCPESPKKAIMINEIYDALLQSALEDQSQHFEGELIRLRAELAASEVKQLTPEERYEIDQIANAISELRTEADRLSKENLDMVGQEAGYRASYERLLREQQVQQSLYEKIKKETSRERAEGESQVEELEQQLRDLNAYLKIQQEFSQNQEVRNSRIFGTSYNTQKSDLKTTLSGKKSRRLFRRGG